VITSELARFSPRAPIGLDDPERHDDERARELFE